MKIEPQKEHQWLQGMVGEWSYEHEAVMGPDKPCEKFKGNEVVRAIGDVWVMNECRGEMPGGGMAVTVMTLGFDPAKKKFVGTFIASMMTRLWVYEGTLDPTGNVLTLETEGPNFAAAGKMTKYKDVIEMKNADHRVMSSHMLGEDGKWFQIMTANYHRK